MKRGYAALDIANWFLWYNREQQLEQLQDNNYDVYEGLTHLKIQKLLYYADGINLAITGKPLFEDKIYAWPHGPVIKNVYEKLSSNGSNEILFDDNNWEKIKKMNLNRLICPAVPLFFWKRRRSSAAFGPLPMKSCGIRRWRRGISAMGNIFITIFWSETGRWQ